MGNCIGIDRAGSDELVTAWQMVLAEMQMAEADEEAYCRGELAQADRAFITQGLPIPEKVYDEALKRHDAVDRARLAMLDAPAPNPAALKAKLLYLLQIEPGVDQTPAWDRREVAQVLADIERLL